MKIQFLDKIKKDKNVGAKAFYLSKMKKNGISVPNAFVLDTDFFSSFLKKNKLDIKINEKLKKIKKNIPTKEIEKISLEIEKEILKSKFDKKTSDEIKEKIKKLQSKTFAIRSSANLEDSKEHSWAGQFDSFLNIKKIEIEENIKKVWASSFSPTALSYKIENNIESNILMSVIIQEMIEPTVSGVAFSINPITKNNTEIVINASNGLGDKIVDGKINPYEYLIEKNDLNILSQPIKTEVLKKDFLISLSKIIIDLENYFRLPVDVEWAIDKNHNIYILQSRPITIREKLNIFDNSNISESYAGQTSPLTFSFAKEAYREVYKEFALLMGVSKKELSENSDIFSNMIIFIGHKFYYNLLNWYRMISLFPGYSISKDFMEKMMGVSKKFRNKIEYKQKNKILSWIISFYKMFKIIFIFSTMKKSMKKFNTFFDNYYKKEKDISLKEYSLEELEKRYRKIEKDLIKNWRIPIANDFAVMVAVGLAEKKYIQWTGKNDFYNFITSSDNESFISLEPGKKLNEILFLIQSNKNIFNKNLKPEEILKNLKNNLDNKLTEIFFEYLEEFSNRVPNELKLESESLDNDPTKLIEILQSYSFKNINKNNIFKENFNHLIFWKRWILIFLFDWSKNSIARREESRFRRSQAFDLIRKIFIQSGDILKSNNSISNTRDIFYLKVDEIFYGNKDEFKTKVENRKNKEKKYRKIKFKKRLEFFGTEKDIEEYYFSILSSEETSIVKTDSISGKVTSQGINKYTTGNIVVMKNFDSKINLQNKILVTKYTDPGWTVVFPFLKGIIIENGGMLSHASIVAREFKIPCIVGVENATSIFQNNQKIKINTSTGKIKIL